MQMLIFKSRLADGIFSELRVSYSSGGLRRDYDCCALEKACRSQAVSRVGLSLMYLSFAKFGLTLCEDGVCPNCLILSGQSELL